LNAYQRDAANDGRLFAEFGHVWEDDGILEDCSGAFQKLVQLRQGGKDMAPKDIRDLAEVCCLACGMITKKMLPESIL
jgi:hypothetical protein